MRRTNSSSRQRGRGRRRRPLDRGRPSPRRCPPRRPARPPMHRRGPPCAAARERVEARREQGADRVGDGQRSPFGERDRSVGLDEQPAIRQEPHVFLGEQRVALARARRSAPRSSAATRAPSRFGHEGCRVLVGEGRQVDPLDPAERARGTGAAEQLRAGGAETSSGTAVEARSELRHEVEQRVVRPVEVLERRRPAGRARPAPGTSARRRTPPRGRRLAGDWMPTSGSRRARNQSRSATGGRTASSLAVAIAGSSPSRMPAWALTISPSAQNVTPSPYGRHRPWRQATPGERPRPGGAAPRRGGSCRSRVRR